MKQIALLNVVGLTQSADGLHRTKKKKVEEGRIFYLDGKMCHQFSIYLQDVPILKL